MLHKRWEIYFRNQKQGNSKREREKNGKRSFIKYMLIDFIWSSSPVLLMEMVQFIEVVNQRE